MKFSEEEIEFVLDEVKNRLSEKRFCHTLSVLKAARYIGSFFECIDLSELSVAAALHDVTKELTYEEHIELLNKSGAVVSDEDIKTAAVLHSLSAPAVILRDFPKYATESVISAVKNHTMGDAKMSLFDRIVFIADYVEETRSYESCINVREELYSGLSLGNDLAKNEYALNKAVYDSLCFTEKDVLKRGRKLNSKSIESKDYFCKLLKA